MHNSQNMKNVDWYLKIGIKVDPVSAPEIFKKLGQTNAVIENLHRS